VLSLKDCTVLLVLLCTSALYTEKVEKFTISKKFKQFSAKEAFAHTI